MKFCPECGTGHDCTADAERATASDAVRIAEIERDKEIALAKIRLRDSREWNEAQVEMTEVQADAEVEAAAVEGEVIAAAIEAGVVADETVEPVIIDVDATADGGDADASEELPPVEGSPAPEPSGRKSIGLGMW